LLDVDITHEITQPYYKNQQVKNDKTIPNNKPDPTVRGTEQEHTC